MATAAKYWFMIWKKPPEQVTGKLAGLSTDVILNHALPELQQDAGVHMEQAKVNFGALQIGVVGELRHHAVGIAEGEADIVRGTFDVLGNEYVGTGFANSDETRQVQLATDGGAAVGKTDVRDRGFTHSDVHQRDDLLDLGEQRRGKRALGKPDAGGVDGVAGRLCWIGDLDEVQSELASVPQVVERDWSLLERDQHGTGSPIRVRNIVCERLRWPLHGLPERFQLA